MTIYGASDYAVTDNGGDYSVHVIVGVDPQSRIYLLDVWRQQTSPDRWIDAFCDLALKWKPMGWAEEQGQIRASIGPFLDQRARERKAYVYREQFPTLGHKARRAQSIRGRMALDGLYGAGTRAVVCGVPSRAVEFSCGQTRRSGRRPRAHRAIARHDDCGSSRCETGRKTAERLRCV